MQTRGRSQFLVTNLGSVYSSDCTVWMLSEQHFHYLGVLVSL